MKIFYTLFFIAAFSSIATTQTPDWQAYLLVDQSWNGNTDTIWFGLDYDATNGYDSGLDIMDTTFSYPLAIRLQNGQVQADSNTCAANMRRDIKAFAPEVTWDVFVKADTFTADENLPIDSNFFLRWDTAQFNYSDGQFEFLHAYITTNTGYINGIDGVDACLTILNPSCPTGGSFYNKASLIYIGIQPPEYTSSFCTTGDQIFKFTLHVAFDDLLNVNTNNNQGIEFINQYSDRLLQINNINGGAMQIEVFQLNGNHVFKTQSYETNYNLYYRDLISGLLIIRVIANDNIPYVFSLINY